MIGGLGGMAGEREGNYEGCPYGRVGLKGCGTMGAGFDSDGAMERVMQDFDRGPDFRITKVWAKNFRSIADVSLEMDALTILVGPNASGKSNLLDILRFIKDALRDMEVAVSRRQGMEGIARHGAGDGDLDIEMGVAAVVRSSYAESGYYSVKYGFTLASIGNGGYRVGREYGKVKEGDGSDAVEFRVEDGNLADPDFLLSRVSGQAALARDESDFDTNDLALPIFLRMYRQLIPREAKISKRKVASLYNGLRELHRNLVGMRFYHIFPNTVREPRRPSNTLVLKEDAENLASAIKGMKGMENDSRERLRDDVELLMPGVSDVRVEPVGGYLVVKLKREAIAGDPWIDLSMESDGVVRLLGLVVALYQRPYLPVIGIEEPELTAHPDTLAVLADMINEAARRSQVIVTTHSPDLIDFLTEYKAIESLRIVELEDGVTTARPVGGRKTALVKKRLASPGELHRIGQLTVSW